MQQFLIKMWAGVKKDNLGKNSSGVKLKTEDSSLMPFM